MTISPTASKKNTPDKKGKLGFLNSFSPSLCSTRILKHLDSLRAFSDADARENTRNNQASEKASSWFHEQPPRYSGGAGVPRPPLSSATPNGKSRRLNLKPILKKTSSHSPVVTRRKVSFQSDSSPSAASHFPRLSSVVARREEKKRPIDIDSYYQPPPVVPNLTLLDPEKLTVCLDLDETLIHSELIYPKSSSAADFAELVQQTSSLKDSTAKRHGGRSMLNPAHSFVMAGKQGAVAIHVYGK